VFILWRFPNGRSFFLKQEHKFLRENLAKNKGPNEKEKSELFEQIGRLKMENEWLKKKLETLG
jgi:hypothetical protein